MARRELKDRHIRKLTRTGRGGRSICVTITIEYIRKLKWRERQKVNVRLDENKIIITDWTDQSLPFKEKKKKK